MSDDALNSARLHLSEAAQLAGTMAGGYAMKKLQKALNRCNPIGVNPHSPQGYADNSFQGGNVGQPAQSPQYSVGSYPEGHAIEANFPSPPDPCQGMKEMLAVCKGPQIYSTDSSGHEHADDSGQFTSGGGKKPRAGGGKRTNLKPGDVGHKGAQSNQGSGSSLQERAQALAEKMRKREEAERAANGGQTQNSRYEAAPPLPVTEYPGDTIPPAHVRDVMTDPCQGMKDMLASCNGPQLYTDHAPAGSPQGGQFVSSGGTEAGGDEGAEPSTPEVRPTTSGTPKHTQHNHGKHEWELPGGGSVILRHSAVHVKDRSGYRDPSKQKNVVVIDLNGQENKAFATRGDSPEAAAKVAEQAKKYMAKTFGIDASVVWPHLNRPTQNSRYEAAPALEDPCAGMKSKLASCKPPATYCPSFMGQPTGAPLAGTPQPVDVYSTLSAMAQEQYAVGHKPKGPGGGQFTSGGGSGGSSESSKPSHLPQAGSNRARGKVTTVNLNGQSVPSATVIDLPDFSLGGNHKDSSTLLGDFVHKSFLGVEGNLVHIDPDGKSVTLRTRDGQYVTLDPNDTKTRDAELGKFKGPTQNSAAYSYPQNPDGRAQGPMTAIPQGDFLGGDFGPGIKRMRESLANCRR